MNTLQSIPGISLAGIFPGLPEILDHVILGLAILAIIAILYIGIGLMLAVSRGTLDVGADDSNVRFHTAFIAATALPVVGLATAGIPGLITGSIAGAIIALATAWAWRRRRAAEARTHHASDGQCCRLKTFLLPRKQLRTGPRRS